MSNTGFKEKINYSEDKKREEIQHLKEKEQKLLARSDSLNLEITNLQEKQQQINHILMMWYNNRTLDKKEKEKEKEIQKIDSIRKRIDAVGKEKDKLREDLIQTRKRLEELQQMSKRNVPDSVPHYPSL